MTELKQETAKPARNIKKKLLSIFGVLLFASVVFAAYTVLTTTIPITVSEPFSVSYAIVDDPNTLCSSLDSSSWYSVGNGSSTIPAGSIYPGEYRKICVKVDNASEASLSYGFTYGGTGWSQADRTEINNSPVAGNSSDISAIEITIHEDAIPETYEPTISVTRG